MRRLGPPETPRKGRISVNRERKKKTYSIATRLSRTAGANVLAGNPYGGR